MHACRGDEVNGNSGGPRKERRPLSRAAAIVICPGLFLPFEELGHSGFFLGFPLVYGQLPWYYQDAALGLFVWRCHVNRLSRRVAVV